MPNDTETLTATIARQLEAAEVPLRAGERPDWEREARLLVAGASVDDPTRTLDQLLQLRLSGIPLAYLVGTETFLGDDYEVETGVVIPHPATELLAQLVLKVLDAKSALGATPRLLEIGVGVGVVSIFAAKQRPDVEVHGSELVGAALRLTRRNAERLLADPERIKLYQAYAANDIFSPFAALPVREANLVVANPPYMVEGDTVSEATKKSGIAHFSFAPENDPSWFLRRVLDAPEGLLSENCSVLMECADWHLADHESVMKEGGWQIEVFDRQNYLARFGPVPQMHEMTRPTVHRVLHAWRGAGGELGV